MKKGLNILVVLFFVIALLGIVSSLEKESFKFEKASDKLNIGESLRGVISTAITDSNLPNFLKDINSNENENMPFNYTQKIYPIGNLELQNFSDNDYNGGEYTIGIRIPTNTFILNYTLDFIHLPEWNDLVGKNLYFLGKEYEIIQISEANLAINLSDSEENLVELRNDKDVKLNGQTISDLECYILVFSGEIHKITLEWKADEDLFITEENNVKMPGIETLSFRFEGLDEISEEIYGNVYLDAFYEEATPISSANLECTDSDGGLDYFDSGTAIVTKEGASSEKSFEDTCLKDFSDSEKTLHVALGTIEESDKDDDKILLEAECLDILSNDLELEVLDFPIVKLVTKYECPNGCEDGKCIGSSSDYETQDSGETNQQENNNQEQNQEQESSQNQNEEKFYIQNKVVSIEKNSQGKNVISVEGKSVETGLDVVTESGKVYVVVSSGNKEIKISSDEAISLAEKISEVKDIIITQKNSEAVYVVTGTKKARLFFIIPINADVEQDINVEDGEVIFTKRPWWSFLAWGI